jgi:5-methylcytosine-specific restriction endonuclease McrA
MVEYHKKYNSAHRQERREESKRYRIRHKDKIKAYANEYIKTHSKEISARGKVYHNLHKKEINKKSLKYYYSHKNEMKATKSVWLNNNRDLRRSYSRKDYRLNKERYMQSQRIWRNTPKGKMFSKKVNALRRSLTKDLTIAIIQRVYEDNIKQYGTLTCIYCLKPIKFGKDTLEHKLPLSRGGTNARENLDIACVNCNSKKQDKTELEYVTYLTEGK